MKTIKYLLAICLFLVSCDTEKKVIDLYDIDVDTSLDTEDIFSSVSFVPLETTEDCLLRTPNVFAADDENVFIWDRNNIYRFALDGKFRNRIGTFGKGHGEHGSLNSANYDKKHWIVLLGTRDGFIYKYDINGNYLGRFRLTSKKEMLQAARWNSDLDCMVCEVRKYTADGLTVYLKTVSADGEELKSYTVYSDKEKIGVSMYKTGMLRNGIGGAYFKLPFDNRLFLLSSEGLSVELTLDQGKNTPSRRYIEDMEYREMNSDSQHHIDKMVITDKYIFLSIIQKRACQEVIVSRETNTVVYNSVYSYGPERHIRIPGMAETTFWPWVSDGNTCMDLLHVEEMGEQDLQRLGIDIGAAEQMGMGLNPILVIAKQ